ncbi:MAG: Penicillin-insensitive murein endopeptidase [Solirubrobacteraceae bacterium]|jgi:murein endopeptidase|nr:Penicillin-insensitive murein endopeptidase [Solirubrobacteraceae bacterium]
MFARQSERGRAPGAVRGGIARDHRSVLFGGARRRRLLIRVLIILTLAGIATGGKVALAHAASIEADYPDIAWQHSVARGTPNDGRLVRGVQLPEAGPMWFTWDWQTKVSPNAEYRRWGTDTTIRSLLSVMTDYWQAFPIAPRVGVADIARPHGGPFGKEYGGLGHASHQNGLDVDVLYPRADGQEKPAARPAQVDQVESQELVDLFVLAGAKYVFVGPNLSLTGPPKVVQKLIYHDDHMHVRFKG